MLNTEQARRIIRETGASKEHLVEILLRLQAESGCSYVDDTAAALVAEELDLPLPRVREILHFYAMLEVKPQGRYIIGICNSSPCAYSRSEELADLVKSRLGIEMGQTTPDGLFSLKYIPCVGACAIGPVLKIGDEVYGDLTEEKVDAILADLRTRV